MVVVEEPEVVGKVGVVELEAVGMVTVVTMMEVVVMV